MAGDSLNGRRLAGSVHSYSNHALSLLAEALGRFASPRYPEKSLEELQQLRARIEKSEPRLPSPGRVRAVSTERRLSKEQLDDLLSCYAAGASANEIGLELGIAAASIMRIVRKHGVEVHDRFPSEQVVRQASELYESGLSLQRVADQIGYSKSTTRRALLGAGVELRRPRRR